MGGKTLDRRAMLGGVAAAIGFGSIGTASADVVRTVRLHDTVKGVLYHPDHLVDYTADVRLQIQYTDEEHNNRHDENENKIYVKGSLTGTGYTDYTSDEQEYRVQANINEEARILKGYDLLLAFIDIEVIPVPHRGQEIETVGQILRISPPYDPDTVRTSGYLI